MGDGGGSTPTFSFLPRMTIFDPHFFFPSKDDNFFFLGVVMFHVSTPTFSFLPRMTIFDPHFFFPSKDDNFFFLGVVMFHVSTPTFSFLPRMTIFFFLVWSCFMKSVKRWINNIEWATLQRYYTQYDNNTNTIWVLFEAFSPILKLVLGRNSSFSAKINIYFIDLVLS